MTNPLANFSISNMYPNNIAFIAFPNGYDSNLNYSITSLDTTIATITEGNVINAIAIGSTTITFSQNGYDISTTFTIEAVPVLVNADNKTIVYGDSIPNLTYNISQNIQDLTKSCSTEKIGISIARQKIGYGINLQSGTKISDLTNINLSRFDSGNSTNPYLNIWVTNSDYSNYAAISISPTWFKEYTNASYNSLKNEDIFIYETTGVQLAATGNYPSLTLGYQGTSWIANVSGVSGATSQLKLSDLAHLEIKAPPASWFGSIGGPYINGTGSGAPRELATHNAYGFNWIFGNINNNGDGTLADYIISKATCNQSNLFYSYIIRNANNGIAPTILTQNIYNPSNISIGNNPISTLASISSHVGTYDITFDNTKFTSIYNLTFTKGTLTITKAIINVTTVNKSRIYGASNPNFTYTYSGLLNSDPESIISGLPSSTTTAILTSNVGLYDIITNISGLSSTNYTFTKNDGILTITQATVNVRTVNKSRIYGAPNPNFTYDYNGLLNGDDEKIIIIGIPTSTTTATLTSNVGDYQINTDISGLSSTNYIFTKNDGKLTIDQAIVNVITENKSRIYGAINPTFTYDYSGLLNGDPETVIIGIPTSTTTATLTSNIGDYQINTDISSLSSTNYIFTKNDGKLTITKSIINVTTVNKSRIYGDSNPTFTYTYSGLLNSDPETVITGTPSSTTTAILTSNIGDYDIITDIVSLSSTNYTFTKNDGILTVAKAVINVTADDKSKVYGAINPSFTYTISGYQNGEDLDSVLGTPSLTSSVDYTSNASTYPINISLPYINSSALILNNYDVVLINGYLTVTKTILTLNIANKSRLYGALEPVFTYTYSGYLNNDSDSNVTITGTPVLSTTATIRSNVGTYPISANLSNLSSTNYTFTHVNGTLTITKAIVNVITENKSRIYGDSNPTFTYTYSGLLNSDLKSIISGSPSSTTTATLTSNIGDYDIITNISGLLSTNYIFTKNDGILTVAKAVINVIAEDKSKVYGTINPAFTYIISGYQNGENLDDVLGTPSLTSSVNSTSNASTYAIFIDLPNKNNSAPILTNYDVVLINGYLTVTKATLTLNIADKSRLYGQPESAFTYTYSGFLNSDSDSNVTITGTPVLSTTATIRSNVGTYPISASLLSLSSTNYTFTSANGTLTITQAIINVTTVNKSRIYGANNPEFTYTYNGLLNSDPESVITGSPSSTTTATLISNVGLYDIITNISGLSSTNYSFTKNDGVLTVTKANIIINAVNKSRLYGDSNPTFTYTYTGFLNSDNIDNININRQPSSTTLANEISPIGNYDIIPDLSNLLSTNYTFTSSKGILTIDQAILSVTAKNKSRMYGSSNPSFDYLITGYKNNDPESIINNINTINLSTPALINSVIGNYNIIPFVSGLSAHNYTFIGINGILTITQAILNLTAHNKSKNYGDNNPNLTYTITGYVLGESNLVTGIPDIYTTATISSPVLGPNSDKTYPIIVTNLSLNAPNYSFNYIYGKLTINPIMPIVNWKQLYTPDMIYGCKLTDVQISALSTDKITGINNGIFTYTIVNNNNAQTQVSLGSIIPTTGTYTLYATLNVVNTNYLTFPLITINKKLTVVTANLNVIWYNPVSINHNTPLTDTQLNAVCNAPIVTTNYLPGIGNTLPVGNQTLSVIFNTTDPGYSFNQIKNSVNINIT